MLRLSLERVVEHWNVLPGDGFLYFTLRPPWVAPRRQGPALAPGLAPFLLQGPSHCQRCACHEPPRAEAQRLSLPCLRRSVADTFYILHPEEKLLSWKREELRATAAAKPADAAEAEVGAAEEAAAAEAAVAAAQAPKQSVPLSSIGASIMMRKAALGLSESSASLASPQHAGGGGSSASLQA